MTSWQTELTEGIKKYREKFEDAKKNVPPQDTRIQNELQKIRDAETAVSRFVATYTDESRHNA